MRKEFSGSDIEGILLEAQSDVIYINMLLYTETKFFSLYYDTILYAN